MDGGLYMFQSLGRDSVHSSSGGHPGGNLSAGFQSLGRDSVHSSCYARDRIGVYWRVSIPRSGFCSFKPRNSAHAVPYSACFNPSVGILFIQADTYRWYPRGLSSFNPSVGILFIQAPLANPPRACGVQFQSLGRDSVHSSCHRQQCPTHHRRFQSLGRDSVHSSFILAFQEALNRECFNPSVGILFIQAFIFRHHRKNVG